MNTSMHLFKHLSDKLLSMLALIHQIMKEKKQNITIFEEKNIFLTLFTPSTNFLTS